MSPHWSDLPAPVLDVLRQGTVIPAHPLALNAERRLDPVRQRALTRYYLDAGAGGLAVGVHSTQFAIREVGLYEPVLSLAAETAHTWVKRPVVLIAGLIGRTEQAVREAETARALGYHIGMLSLGAMRAASMDEILSHCRAVAKVMPLMGFYMQSAVGGIDLPFEFWRDFAQIDNVLAIKIAPFSRYRTLDVVRGVVAAQAENRITLYTGNDDHIVLDLLTPFDVQRDGEPIRVRIKGGLLGHWGVWTRCAVEMLERIHQASITPPISADWLAVDAYVTDMNAALFDVAHNFAGCLPGCLEVLRRQGILEGHWCLDPHETLSPGQAQELDRVCREHADLCDDTFVRANLNRWLAN
ncbi:MAG: dihydrodipicolinate synthase family protein [Anaerolineales bacterium]